MHVGSFACMTEALQSRILLLYGGGRVSLSCFVPPHFAYSRGFFIVANTELLCYDGGMRKYLHSSCLSYTVLLQYAFLL